MQETIETFPWGGVSIPGWPIATWRWDAGVIGDGSGGVRELDIVFQSALSGQPLGTQLYNIEQLAVGDTNENSLKCRMSVLTLGKHSQVQRWSLAVNQIVDIGSALDLQDVRGVRGLFFGGQSIAGASAVVAIDIDNVDLAVFTAVAMGYVWTGGVNSVPGGPVRPDPRLWP